MLFSLTAFLFINFCLKPVTKNGCLSREYNSDSEQKTFISSSNGAWSDQCHALVWTGKNIEKW